MVAVRGGQGGRMRRGAGGEPPPKGQPGTPPAPDRDPCRPKPAEGSAASHLVGGAIPALPDGEHPDDLLNDKEAADVLGIGPGTVRAYAGQGYLSRDESVYGTRVWPRHEIEDRRDNPPGQGKGGGRRPGQGQGPRKAHAYEGDPRLHTATEALDTAGPGTKKTGHREGAGSSR
ncbi:hypothetical protein ACFXPI_19105 [Streptomyces sp. NPDC059104]|uniref:hypothetical protein n=1 Tax=Streptomyces sp. NPDC059104 TaxID=3346729 RepID=UPI003678AFB2